MRFQQPIRRLVTRALLLAAVGAGLAGCVAYPAPGYYGGGGYYGPRYYGPPAYYGPPHHYRRW